MQNLNKKFLEFKNIGWVKFEKFLTKKQVNYYKNKINSSLKKNHKKYNGRDINYASDKVKLNQINSFHKMHDFKWVKKFSKSKKINHLAKIFLKGSKPELRASEVFFKPKKHGLKAPIHQDNFYWKVKDANAFTIWISLNKSDKKNGGVFYFDESHKGGLLDHVESFSKGSSQKVKNEKKLKKYKLSFPNLNPGDALMHHCLTVHGSKKNRSNKDRKGWTFQFKDKNCPYDMLSISKYEKSLNKQLKTR